MFETLAGLNDEQRAAAGFVGDTPLRILAGAGTGKTTALASRVAWLVETGTPPERILLLTFTRRAARQMLSRSETLLAGVRLTAGRRHGRVQGGGPTAPPHLRSHIYAEHHPRCRWRGGTTRRGRCLPNLRRVGENRNGAASHGRTPCSRHAQATGASPLFG